MEKDLVIREAKKEDSKQIIDLFAQLSFETTEENLINFFENKSEIIKSSLFVAELNKEVLGVIDFSVVDYFYYQKPILCVRAIVIDQRYRSLGIGNKLMGFAEDTARVKNCHYIELVSGQKRKDAHRFYSNLGFIQDTHYYFRKLL